jgi:hypothetical protein
MKMSLSKTRRTDALDTIAIIDGTVGADTIAFTTKSTTVNAYEGANTITGTTGNNHIIAGIGADTISVTTGHNTIDAGGGVNTIVATTGDNLITTGDGADTITVSTGDNTIHAGGGANTITASSGNNTITAGDGADTITTSGSTGGTNTVHAGNGANTVTTGAGNDIVTSGNGADTITTAAGDDTITIKGGIDTIAAGAGNDTLIADLTLATSAVSLSALAGTAAAGYAGNISGLGVATFAGVENFEITSGVFNDTITTGDGTDVVHAGAGDDTVNLAGGNDEAIYTMTANTMADGTHASDVYQGGTGVDTLTLEFTDDEWLSAGVQADVAKYQEHLKNVSLDPFVFDFGLTVSEFEALRVIVDGEELDPNAVATDDFTDLAEDDFNTEFNSVLENDAAALGAYSVKFIERSDSLKGNLTFSPGKDGAPDGSFSFDPNDEFEYLAEGESEKVIFVYEVQDAYRGPSQATATIRVAGENDRPVADAFSTSLGEDDASVLITASGSDADVTDNLTFKILSAPMDDLGNQYGSVNNNGDGEFLFSTGDNFQFLNDGETREMTFTYVAVDDSGTATNTSAAQTVTIGVTGSNDAPLTFDPTFNFETTKQSIYKTGAASIKDPDLPFLGGSWDQSFSVELVPGVSGGIDGIPAVITPAITSFIPGVPDIPAITVTPAIPGITVSTPSISLNGSTSGKIGLQPFFSMTGGDIDATIPIAASFSAPKQVEAGESFTLSSAFLFGANSSITTQSPEISFGVDMIFDVAGSLTLDFSSSSFGGADFYNLIPSFDTGPQKHNIFTLKSGEIGGEIPLGLFFQNIPQVEEFLTLTVNTPNVTTTGGFSTDADGLLGPITSKGTDEIASLTLDIDEIIAAGLSALSGGAALDIMLGFEGGYSFGIDTPLGDVNLAGFDVIVDLLSSELSTSISLLQDFSLELKDLPLEITLEDGSIITGFSLGDEVTITAPVDFDADVDGDKDGYIDFTVDVDMDAVLTTMVSLGFDTTFALGAVRAIGSVTSDIGSDFSFNAFEGEAEGTADDFLYYDSAGLVNEEVVLSNDTFDLVGFMPGSQNTTNLYFDVA